VAAAGTARADRRRTLSPISGHRTCATRTVTARFPSRFVVSSTRSTTPSALRPRMVERSRLLGASLDSGSCVVATLPMMASPASTRQPTATSPSASSLP